MDTPFFRLIEERSPEEIAEEMRWAFGPSKGRMDMTISGGELFAEEVIIAPVFEALNRMIFEASRNIIALPSAPLHD